MNIMLNRNGSNFFSSGLRQKVDQLMDILYSGGVNNPMDSIEQISYLLFLRLLSEKDDVLATLDKKYERVFSGKTARYAWGNFVTLTGDALFDAVRDAIEHLHELPKLTETGKLLFNRATLKIYDRPTLRAVVQGILVSFKTESFIVLSQIAWVYLLHAHYRAQRIEYRYFKR
jgi:HsdM N-terminal domain